MAKKPNFFRDFGILPIDLPRPPRRVRASFGGGQVFGQYLATGLVTSFGLGIIVLFALTLPVPINVLASVAALAIFGSLVYLMTRNDYVWIELKDDTLRAKHLYTRRVVERPVDDIEDLLTHVLQIRTLTTVIVEAWLGRVRGVEIRFYDQRTPLRVSRVDPAMKNAEELIQAVIYQMAKLGELDAEVIDFQGKPLIRRIYWKE